MKLLILGILLISDFFVDAFTASSIRRPAFAQSSSTITQNDVRSCLILFASRVGVFYGTSTGNTESVAYMIVDELGQDVAHGPFVVDDIAGFVSDKFSDYDALIVGTPTWNTGADRERSGTTWDELYYGEMQDLNISGKKVAVFGLGDQVSYKENYADATGELHDIFQGLGCQMMGYTSQTGYKHKQSKAIRGDKFCGLLCDNVNQEDLTEDRVKNWIKQLKTEGFLEPGTSSSPTKPISAVVEPMTTVMASESVIPEELQNLDRLNENFQTTLSEPTKMHSPQPITFNPHYNPETGITMYVSTDGKFCFYSSEKP